VSAPGIDDRRRGRRALSWSALTLFAFALLGATPGSPFHPVLAPGGEPTGPLTALARALRLDDLGTTAITFVGVGVVVAAAVAFLAVLREARAGSISLRSVLWLAVAAHAVLLMLPLLYSRDVYSYAIYGRIAHVYGENPYVSTPIGFAADPLLRLVGPKWLDTPPVYGPAFVTFAALVSRFADATVEHVAVYRILAIGASLATVGLIATTVRRWRPGWEAVAVAAFGLNPVILFHSVASGHNDLLVALGIVGAFALVLRGRELPAVAVLSVAALVKATAALPLLLLLVWSVARRRPEERVRAASARVGLAAAIAAAFALPYWQTQDPTLGMLELARHTGWLAPSVFITRLVDVLSFGTLGWAVRVVFGATLLVGVVAISREVWRRAGSMSPLELGGAWGWSLVLLMVLGPVLLPWYVAWSLPLAWLLPRAPRTTLLVTSVALGVSLWSAEPERSLAAFEVNLWIGHWVITPVVTGLLLRTLRDLRSVVRGLPFAEVSATDRDLRADVARATLPGERQAGHARDR
jgi:hypothetical protein